MSADERVRIAVDGGVAVVTLSRPDKHNALDRAMFDGLADATARLAGESSVRAVVLHGAGPSFCSGLDFVSVMAQEGGLEAQVEELRAGVPNHFQRAAHDWIALPVPVIAAVHGACFGGGLQIALAADVRFATADARLSVMEVAYGLIPDMGITRTLPRLVRADVAKELTYTGRIVSGAEALELGLVSRVCDDPLAAARSLAGEIAARSPEAVRAAKRLFDEAWSESSAERSLALEAALQQRLIGSPNQVEAVRAALEKRAGSFVDPR